MVDQKIFEDLGRITQLLPTPIYWLNSEAVLIGANENFFKTMGVTQKYAIGTTAYDVYPEKIAKHIIGHDMQVMRTGVASEQEEPTQDISTGKPRYFTAFKAPIRDKKGKIVGLVGTLIEITAQKKKIELEKHQAILDEKIKVLQLMGGAVAHELRTPLATISLAAQAVESVLPSLFKAYHLAVENNLMESVTNEARFKLIETVFDSIKEEVKASNAFIDNMLLNIQNLAADPNDMEVLSIQKCIEEAMTRYPFDERARQFTHVKIEHDFYFRGMPVLMQHVVFNLLRNGIYYVLESSKDNADITIWTEQGKDGWNELHFKDTGTGIDDTHMKHVFERFFSKRYHGTGVGLAFCKQVITQFGGVITCDSKLGEYTHFIMRFPPVNEKKELLQA